MKQSRIHLVGIDRIIEDTHSRIRSPIPDGSYTPATLVELLKDGWVSFFECRKCGWFRSYPYPRRIATESGRARDTQCEIVVAAMRNFAEAWWNRVVKMTPVQRSAFLDAFFFYTQYVIDTHIGMGTLVNNLNVEWWGERMARSITTSPLFTRPILNRYAEALRRLPERTVSEGHFAIVEGESEEAFVRRLQDLRFLSSHLEVHPLSGKSNARPSRLPLGLLRRQGYAVTVQLDGDSAKRKAFQRLEETVRAAGGLVFVFSRDFESSFPAPLLRAALADCGYDVEVAWLQRLKRRATGPVLCAVEQKTGMRITKVRLAERLAEYVNDDWGRLLREYPRAEITRWVSSLRTGPSAPRPKPSRDALSRARTPRR